ncbi:MAG: NAD(P)H-dependent FMN reductase [Patiriisocius sp.]|jgi:NAD(P)H-dependent FMN reductase
MNSITLVLGTARAERSSEAVTTALQNAFTTKGVTVNFVDVKDHVKEAVTLPDWGVGGANEVPTRWQETVASSTSFVFVLPEYNHGYPGEWKLLIDSLSKSAYAGKKAYTVAVSAGNFAGVRLADHVLPVYVELMLQPMPNRLYIGSVKNALSTKGEVLDASMQERIDAFVDTVLEESTL